MRRLSSATLAGMVFLATLAGMACATPSSSTAGDDGELLVSVAVSLAPAIREVAAAYEAEHAGRVVLLNPGASGVLLQQVRHGAPVDLFLSASSDELDRLGDEDRIDRGRAVVLAFNRLVLVTPPDGEPDAAAPLRLESYAAIALGNPRTAPLGRYTQQALTALGVWESVQARAVLAENARQVIEYVARGEVEAGIVYLSDASLLGGRVRRGPLLDPGTHQPIAYHGAVLNAAPHPAAAADFLAFLQSPFAVETLARHGFSSSP